MPLKLVICAILLIFIAPAICWPSSFPFEDARPLYIGARALGMGNAFTAVADNATTGFWNPAGLVQWQGVKIFGMRKIRDRGDYAFDPKGIGYSYRRNAFFWGNKIALGVADGTPDFNYYSFARQLNAYVAMGVSLKFKRRHPANYYQFFGSDFSYDIAILSKPSSRIQIGILAQNLSTKRTVNLLSLGLLYRFNNMIVPVDFVFSKSGIETYFGLEWTLLKSLHLRGGISENNPTLGLGATIWNFRLDYAWIRENGFNSPRLMSHFMSAELSF